MKTYNYILITIGLLLYSSCEDKQVAFDAEIIAVYDKTDPIALSPNTTDILNLSGLNENSWLCVKVELTTITDIDHNPAKTIILNKESQFNGNADVRNAKVRLFERELAHLTDSMGKEKTNNIAHSIIYKPLAIKLNILSKSIAKNRHLTLYSNCMENAIVNFYDTTTLKLIQTNPALIQKLLEKECPLLNLTGISIHCIYYASSYTDNTKFRIASTFLMSIFKSHGATVNISCSTNK